MELRYLRYFIPAALAKALGASHFWRDLYHLFLTVSWTRFLALIALLYIAINTLFALAYLAGGSRVAVVAPFNGMATLMFRAANERRNQILEAQMQMSLVRNEATTEGQSMRRFYDLKLVRNRTPIFSITWTVIHTIDETGPLYRATTDSLAKVEAEIVITLTGIDETVSQAIHARHSFPPQKILWNTRFVDILSRTPDGKVSIDYDRFHDVVPI
jgi:inward rectifier potassium channel